MRGGGTIPSVQRGLNSASSLPLFDFSSSPSYSSFSSFLWALHLSSPPHYPTCLLHLAEFPDPSGAHHGDSAPDSGLLDLLDSPRIINPASTWHLRLLL